MLSSKSGAKNIRASPRLRTQSRAGTTIETANPIAAEGVHLVEAGLSYPPLGITSRNAFPHW